MNTKRPTRLLGYADENNEDDDTIGNTINKYKREVQSSKDFMPEDMSELWIELCALRRAVLHHRVKWSDAILYLKVVKTTLKTIDTALRVNEYFNHNRTIEAPFRRLDNLPSLEELKAFEKSRTG